MTHIKIPTFSDTGEAMDITNFVYDPVKKRWVHRLRVSVEAISRYTQAVVTEKNLGSVGTPILNEKGFIPEVQPESEAEADEQEEAVSTQSTGAPEKTGKRGRQSKYPYRTMAIGDKFLIDSDSVGITLNHSLLGDRAFEIRAVKGRFQVTRTA